MFLGFIQSYSMTDNLHASATVQLRHEFARTRINTPMEVADGYSS